MEIKEFEAEVIDIIQRTHDIKSFRFAIPEDITFKPGQFFFVTIKIKGQEVTKHFSFSNSPTEKGYIEFTKKITDSEFSQTLEKLRVGDWAKLRMPFGSFTFEGEYEKIAFLVGGIGITPVRSMCRFACDRKLPTDIVSIYSNRTEQDIAFYEDFLQMEKTNNRLRVIHTITQPLDTATWKGRTGRISSTMVKEEIPDYAERVFYICGPPKMVDAIKSLLTDELKLGKEKIRTELFAGYQ
ncbi:MAG: FAD-dependent oxidoreductase [Nitrospira sp.]|nr:FAD-dependent oxidoreductase [Nitrospira sp.]